MYMEGSRIQYEPNGKLLPRKTKNSFHGLQYTDKLGAQGLKLQLFRRNKREKQSSHEHQQEALKSAQLQRGGGQRFWP